MAGGTATGDAAASAYARLRADPSIQFSFSEAPRVAPPPGWLMRALDALGHALKAAAPFIRTGVWVVLALGVLLLVAVVVRQGGAKVRRGGPAPLTLHGLGEGAAAARAAARLADADRLAAEGRFGEAIHLLLLSGVDDVERGRPGSIRPALTSRDIAALPGLPQAPRAAFSQIAKVVERALFAGRPVDASAWGDCREAYRALARPEAWAA